MRRLVMPETILLLLYIGSNIYNINQLFKHREVVRDSLYLIVINVLVVAILTLLLIIDIFLRITKKKSQVYNIDTELKSIVQEFENRSLWDSRRQVQQEEDKTQNEKEFSFYQDCFTLTLRNGRW